MPTRVISIREAPKGWEQDPQYVYIGRAGKGHDGKWGNPFRVQEHGQNMCVDLYRHWLHHTDRAKLRQEMKALKGKTLVCFCKPKRCHGDVIAEAAEDYK